MVLHWEWAWLLPFPNPMLVCAHISNIGSVLVHTCVFTEPDTVGGSRYIVALSSAKMGKEEEENHWTVMNCATSIYAIYALFMCMFYFCEKNTSTSQMVKLPSAMWLQLFIKWQKALRNDFTTLIHNGV